MSSPRGRSVSFYQIHRSVNIKKQTNPKSPQLLSAEDGHIGATGLFAERFCSESPALLPLNPWDREAPSAMGTESREFHDPASRIRLVNPHSLCTPLALGRILGSLLLRKVVLWLSPSFRHNRYSLWQFHLDSNSVLSMMLRIPWRRLENTETMSVGQQARAVGSGNVIVQAEGDGINISLGLPHLTLIPPRNRVPQVRTEIDLLNPYGRAIGLVGRDADLQSLWDWLYSSRPISVRTLTGRAGAGKTRAAIELVERLNQEKPDMWWAGFVQGSEMRRFAAQQNLVAWSWSRPTLIVVDYAASLVEPLREWLRDLAQNSCRAGGRPLRLLLLEREAVAGEGWLQYLSLGGHSEAGVPELFDPLEPKRLDRLDTAEKRRAVLAKMLEAAAPLVQCKPPKLPDTGENPRIDKQLENAVWEDPLYLMMAALLSLRTELVEVLELAGTELAMRLADHEIKRLTEGAKSTAAERLLVHLAAFAALGNGLNQEQALEVAEEESHALKLTYPGGAGALVSQVHEVLSAPDLGLAPVVPDILSEALVIRALSQCSKAQQEAAVLRAVKKLGRRVVPFIIRTVQNFAPTGRKEPLNWLENLIKSGNADDLGLLVEIDSAMPMKTIILRKKALEVNDLLVKRLATLSRKNSNEDILSEQARLLNNLANCLKAVGRRDEALNKAQEAVRIYQQLAKARPDAFLPGLATSLQTLGNRLSELGRREEALDKAREALRIRDQLAKDRPEAFRLDLASSLNNLATMLSDLGRREEALDKAHEAVRIYEQLATGQPDKVLPELARSLHNLANRLNDLGRREEALDKAQQAERIFEQLAKAQPDSYLADLASSLDSLAILLSDLGRTEEGMVKGQESLRILEELAKAQPEAFLPELARSLSNLTDKLRILGRHEEALLKGQQAVRIGEQLAKTQPGAFEPGLAGSLNNLAGVLSELGRRDEALNMAQEAVRIRERLARARPDAFLPVFAISLSNLAKMLSELGRRDEALEKAQEATRIQEQLAKGRPVAFLPDFAFSLNNLAGMLSYSDRHEEALEKAREAVRIFKQLATDRPDAYLADLGRSLNNQATMLSKLGRSEEALDVSQEAARIFERLAKVQPDAHLPNLAISLNNLATRLSTLDRREEALEKAEEAVRIYEQLAKVRPDAHLPDLAMSLNNLASRLSALGRREEALDKAQEAVRIREKLANARAEVFLPELAVSLNNLAPILCALGRREEALDKAQEAVRIYKRLAKARPDVFLRNLATSYGTSGAMFLSMERHMEAAGAFEEAIRAITPLFQQEPMVFVQLIGFLSNEYLRALQKTQVQPDESLLAPIIKVFDKLKQNQPKE